MTTPIHPYQQEIIDQIAKMSECVVLDVPARSEFKTFAPYITMSTTKRLTKLLADTIPQGPHPDPHLEFVSVRLDIVKEVIDHIDWLDKGLAEWRAQAMANTRQAEAARATGRVAIAHLQAVLNQARTHDEQQRVDTAARDWLISIGSEPN